MCLQEETLPAAHSCGVEEVGISSEHDCMEITPETIPSPIIKPCKSVKPGQKAPQEAIKLWKENGFSRFEHNLVSILFFCHVILLPSILFPILLFSLIIAAPELDPWGIIKEVLPLLSFSAPFAVYHQYAQVLFLACQTYLMFLAC